MSIERRVAAVLTAFRAETEITLNANAAEVFDTDAGDLAQWCGRHETVLAQHGLYLEAGGQRCRFSRQAPETHARVTWTDPVRAKETVQSDEFDKRARNDHVGRNR